MREARTTSGFITTRWRGFFEFAAGTRALIATLIGVLVMMLAVFPALPIGGEMIDLKLHYGLADIQVAMLQYGSEGRRLYALYSLTLDTVFPAFYVTFFSGLLYRFRPVERLWVLAFIPVFAGVWDLCENAQIITMLVQYPALSGGQVAVASFFTSAKHVLSAVYELIAVAFVAVFLLRKFRQ